MQTKICILLFLLYCQGILIEYDYDELISYMISDEYIHDRLIKTRNLFVELTIGIGYKADKGEYKFRYDYIDDAVVNYKYSNYSCPSVDELTMDNGACLIINVDEYTLLHVINTYLPGVNLTAMTYKLYPFDDCDFLCTIHFFFEWNLIKDEMMDIYPLNIKVY